jgi:preprotein translocase subunit SecY
MQLFESIRGIFRIPDLRKRLLFTFAMLAVYRLGGFIPIPGIDIDRWQDFLQQQSGSILGFFDMFAGGSIKRLSVFALGVMPYITASILLQLLTAIVPRLERLQKEGELGRRKINQWTRYLAVALGIVQAFLMAAGLQSARENIVAAPGAGFILITILSLTTGTAFIMWLGEQITERGIGNGMSLIVFTGIVAGVPSAIGNIYTNVFITREWSLLQLAVVLGMMIAVVAVIVLVELGERRIPVHYARRTASAKAAASQATHMPLKVNAGGVIPVIFASSLLAFPQTVADYPLVRNTPWLNQALRTIRHGEPLYLLFFAALIVFFSFFYVSLVFNPSEVADNMRRYGGFIPGIRPGRPTSDYLEVILTRLTFVGAVYLSVLCLIPDIMMAGIHLQNLPLVGNWIDRNFPALILEGLNVRFAFGGTSLLIVVGVAMDTIDQIEAQLIMRHYEGFTPRAGRIRGRR